MTMICGAVIFAVGAFSGALLYAAGQQSQKSRGGQAFQSALLKNLEKLGNESGKH